MLKIICLGLAMAVVTVPGADAAFAQQKQTKKKCTSPRDICFQKCKGPNCQTICASRPHTC
jgi:hypothetical protein